ncbi:MAG: TolC family protein [Candidatus Aphodosoma sp.]
MKKAKYICIVLLCYFPCFAMAQDTPLLLKYRSMALEYSHDIKAAEKGVEASLSLIKSANQNFCPQLSGSANFKYTGFPYQLMLNLPSATEPVTFTGTDMAYGIGLSLQQPVYSGGRLLETLHIAKYNHQLSTYQEELIRTAICMHADIQYWNTVAYKEIAGILEDYKASVTSLTEKIRERVEAGMTDRQDLLMMEVRLNDADFQYRQSKKNFENSMMALNSLIGEPLDKFIEIDDTVSYFTLTQEVRELNERPELKIARMKMNIAESEHNLTVSKYRPQISVGIDGTYSSPGYNFKSDMDFNYAVYATLSVPISEWGRVRNEAKATKIKSEIAMDNYNKVKDEVNLDIEAARNSLNQTIEQTELARISLQKALENEELAIDRYHEGKASILEVIDAQNYRQNAQMNFVQAKLAAHNDLAKLLKATNAYLGLSARE